MEGHRETQKGTERHAGAPRGVDKYRFLRCYTQFGWMKALELQSSIIVCSWLLLVPIGPHTKSVIIGDFEI